MKKFIAIIDETGTTNRPQEAADSDFGVAALLLPESLVDQMRAVGTEISRVTTSDFKYKHVQKSADARALLLKGMGLLRRGEGIYGLYAAGGSLLNERRRAYEAVKRLQSDLDGSTKVQWEKMQADSRGEMFISFFRYVVPSLGMFAQKMDAKIDIYFDRREDLSDILSICMEANDDTSVLFSGKINPRLKFVGQAERDQQSLVRIAGVLAGDIRCFFRRYGSDIWSRLRTDNDLHPTDFGRDLSQPDEVKRVMRVATITEKIGDDDFFAASSETCLLRAYTKRFLSGLLSFASPDGKLGHLDLKNNASWDILQLPD